MAVHVTFFTPKGVGSIHAPGIGAVRAREALALDGTTTAASRDGESILVFNAEASAVLVAFGPTPDAAATAEGAATSAAVPIAAGQWSQPLMAPAGSKVAAKALA